MGREQGHRQGECRAMENEDGYCTYACKDKRMKDNQNPEGKNLGERFKRSRGLQLRDTVILK